MPLYSEFFKSNKKDMCTPKYFQVEAIVAKYKKLASETEAVKKCKESFTEFFVPSDVHRLHFVSQLVGYIYQLGAGELANENVLSSYKKPISFYIKGLISKEEEDFLKENFDVFLDYAFEHDEELYIDMGDTFLMPSAWSSLVPSLLENCSGKIFIPNSYIGREFVGLNECELVVGSGFVKAALRAYACGLKIDKYEESNLNDALWSDLDDNSFDATIVEWGDSNERTVEEVFNACHRIVKDGGEILLAISKEAVLGDATAFLRKHIRVEKALESVIELPSGKILFHFVKKLHDTIVMCDATTLGQKNDEKVIDVAALQKEVEMANMPEYDDRFVVRRYSYDDLNDKILLPSYYLHYYEGGVPISQVAQLAFERFLTDECSKDDKVVTVNQLSNVFSKGEIRIGNLPRLRMDRARRYYRVEGPAVIVAVSENEIAVGYTTSEDSYLVSRNLYVLKPIAQLDVKYLACKMLSSAMQEQMLRLVCGKRNAVSLAKGWGDLVRIEVPSIEEQQKFTQDVALKDYVAQEEYVTKREKGFVHSVRLRKHALSQNISAFDSLFRSLEYCMQEHNGRLESKMQLSPVCSMTVGEAMSNLRSKLKTICERVAHMTDEQDWGMCEAIEPQHFIEKYEQEHPGSNFSFRHKWDKFETNSFAQDIFDEETGKLLFHRGESMNSAWFPKRALMQVFDNIVSNACEHGFTDKGRKDYEIRTSWATDGFNMIIKLSNNGEPMPADLDSMLVLEYGYSSALNQKGHGGIGGGEIAEIMHKFGGDVEVISSPDNKFTVTYVLKMPLASLY